MHRQEHPLEFGHVRERPRAYTAAGMRELDRRAIEEAGIPGPVLMERAALGVTTAVLERYPGRHTLILCGRGNNGGDGLAAARQLHLAGQPVACVVAAERPEDLSEDAALNYRAAREVGVNLRLGDVPGYLWEETGLVVDCLLGTGATGELREPIAGLAAGINALGGRGVPVLAVDVPTGVDASTGSIAGGTVAADLTVTFHAPKTGLVVPPGSEAAGEVLVWEIGIPPLTGTGGGGSSQVEADVRVVTAADARVPGPRADDHKYRAGFVAVVAGSDDYPGAALLSGRAAARCGAGYVRVVTTAGVRPVIAAHSPELVVMVAAEGPRLDDAAALQSAAGEERINAVVIGPGLGRADDTTAAVRRFVLESTTPAILDADGIYAFNGRATELRAREGLVLTPHAGELAGLLGIGTAEVTRGHLEAARRGAEATGQVLLLKGSSTVIAAPDGAAAVVRQGPPELASAGTGDVLSGCVGALLAKSVSPFDAAATAAWLHAEAGLRVARAGGLGLLAEDVIEALPPIVAEQSDRRKPGWTS